VGPERWRDDSIVADFEDAFARWNGSRFAFSFMGGRVALSALIDARELRPGDEVILPGYTCVVVPNALRWAGVTPVYADIELDTFGLDAAGLEARLTSRTRAVLLHHLYGLVCRDYEAILEFAQRHGLRVIEDCAQATGARHRGRRVGTRGDVAFYSSEHSKVFCTMQGGVAVTDDPEVGARLAGFHEQAPYPEDERIEHLLRCAVLRFAQHKHPRRGWLRHWAGYRYAQDSQPSTTDEETRGERPPHYGQKMPAPLADLGLAQLPRIDAYNRERRRGALRWNRWCEARGYAPPLVIEGSAPAFLRYPVLVEPERKRDLRWAEEELGVRPGVWFESPLHPSDEAVEGCPNAQEAVRRCINLPCLGLPPAPMPSPR